MGKREVAGWSHILRRMSSGRAPGNMGTLREMVSGFVPWPLPYSGRRK